LRIVNAFGDGSLAASERVRLQEYVMDVLRTFGDDPRIVMWDIYNEPGQSQNGDSSLPLLKAAWSWAQAVRPTQPLTACVQGSVGSANMSINARNSDVLTFHWYGPGAASFDRVAECLQVGGVGRPVICTEFMARELGSTFQSVLPVAKSRRVGCLCWGLVAGRSQTIFNWATAAARLTTLGVETTEVAVVEWESDGAGNKEPDLWFHDIFRANCEPYDNEEVEFIKSICRI